MNYIKYKGNRENIAVMTLTLSKLGYKLEGTQNYIKQIKKDPDTDINIILLICPDLLTCHFCSHESEISSITRNNPVISCESIYNNNVENQLLIWLGINRTLEEQIEYLLCDIRSGFMQCIDSILPSESKSNKENKVYTHASTINLKDCNKEKSCTENNFYNSLKPGCVVELLVRGNQAFGFILANKTIVYVNCSGQLMGYLNNYSMDWPHKILSIRVPNKEAFQLKNYTNMSILWQRPKDVKKVIKSVEDIEKELGLEPGSLQVV